MFNNNIVVLRARKGVPGVGRKISRYFNAYEVTCKSWPKVRIPDGAVVFNYGRSEWPVWAEDAISRGCTFLNTPDAVERSVNKITTLELLSTNNVACVEFSTDPKYVYDNLSTKFQLEWLARNTVTGKQGKGIEELYGGTEYGPEGHKFPIAPLYTKHYDKTHEFRVHIFNGKVIDYVQKKRMGSKKLSERGLEKADELLRNHKRGWVFAHKDIIIDDKIKKLALDTAKVLGLDYCGIDILAKVEDGEVADAVVCESNSAPGMSSQTTFNSYVKSISKFIEKRAEV